MTGRWPTRLVDHKNGQLDDDRWSNLRAANHSQNGGNSKDRKSAVSLKGVHWSKQARQFTASIQVKGSKFFLGRFPTARAAHLAYMRAARRYFGSFARAR